MKVRFPKQLALAAAFALVAALGVAPSETYATSITSADILAIPKGTSGSGNGTLDLRMFTQSGSEIKNADKKSGFNGDNGNNQLPTGGQADHLYFDESYVTTVGDLIAFYDLNFPGIPINELVLFLDLNETGRGEEKNTLQALDIILNPSWIHGDPNPAGDVSSDVQDAINQDFTLGAGTLLSSLPNPLNVAVNENGAGLPDVAILTGINLLDLRLNDVLLFNISMRDLNNGSEEIYLSGEIAPSDLPGYEPTEPPPGPIPEPASVLLLGSGLGALGLAAWRRKK